MRTLSVIIPTMDEADYLPRLLKALKEQTLQPLEIIVADAGSKDGTRKIAEDFGVTIVEGGLPGPGRNAGAKVAKGDIFLFLDADMLPSSSTFLEKALDEFEKKGFDIATCDLELLQGTKIDAFGHDIYNAYVRLWGRVRPHAPGGCMMVKKSLHEAIHGFDETVVFCEDHEYAGRAGKKGRFGFLNSVKVGVTLRRFEKEGRFTIAVKFILAELHMWFWGPIRHDLFRYHFGYDKPDE